MKTKVIIQHAYVVEYENKAGLRAAIADLKKAPAFECMRIGADGFDYRRLARSGKHIRQTDAS